MPRAKVTTCLSELKSDGLNELKSHNVTVDKSSAGLVPHLGQQCLVNGEIFISLPLKRSEKVKN
jgi:hypothetical protein